MKHLESIGCWFDHIRGGIKWFGPELWIKGRCHHCHTELMSDGLSLLYGDWCPNENCDFLNGE